MPTAAICESWKHRLIRTATRSGWSNSRGRCSGDGAGCWVRISLRRSWPFVIISPGNRIRPILAMEAGRSVIQDPLELVTAACALELVHTYSLIHDDLPALDNDD